MNPHNVKMILGSKILKIESTNFGLYWTKNRLLSLCASLAMLNETFSVIFKHRVEVVSLAFIALIFLHIFSLINGA